MWKFRYPVCLIFALLYLQTGAFCQTRSIPYAFPVKGPALSKQVGNGFDNRIKVCEVPDSILKILTTEALFTTCLNHPLNFYFTAYDDMQYGFDVLATRSNAYQELFTRKDAGAVILREFKNLKPTDISGISEVKEQSEFFSRMLTLGFLVAHEKVVRKYSITEQKELVASCLEKLQVAKSNNDIGLNTLSMVTLSMGRILYPKETRSTNSLLRSSSRSQQITSYVDTGSLRDQASFEEIETKAKEFILK